MNLQAALNLVEVKEHSSSSYGPRTYVNASRGDITMALYVDPNTAGERLTKKAAGSRFIGASMLEYPDPVDAARIVYRFCRAKGASSINVAGNGIYTLNKHGIDQHQVNVYTYRVLEKLKEYAGIRQLYSGGQTGVDLAAGVAAVALGLPITMLLPKGYRQRGTDGVDCNKTEGEIQAMVKSYAETLLSELTNKE